MRIDILTLFPAMFMGPLEESILARAVQNGLVEIQTHDIRKHGLGRHNVVDDYPYGGGAGMVMKPEPIFATVEEVTTSDSHLILMSPQGHPFDQATARRLSALPHLILLCGHYEGVDERVLTQLVDEELSIGDYVLTGGEIPAMVVCDAVVRLIPGVLGSGESPVEESFTDGLLEYPHYTRPPVYREQGVPDVLLSGDHARVARWRREQSLLRTLQRRPELLKPADWDEMRRLRLL